MKPGGAWQPLGVIYDVEWTARKAFGASFRDPVVVSERK